MWEQSIVYSIRTFQLIAGWPQRFPLSETVLCSDLIWFSGFNLRMPFPYGSLYIRSWLDFCFAPMHGIARASVCVELHSTRGCTLRVCNPSECWEHGGRQEWCQGRRSPSAWLTTSPQECAGAMPGSGRSSLVRLVARRWHPTAWGWGQWGQVGCPLSPGCTQHGAGLPADMNTTVKAGRLVNWWQGHFQSGWAVSQCFG